MTDDEFNRIRSLMTAEFFAHQEIATGYWGRARKPSWDMARSIAMLVLDRYHDRTRVLPASPSASEKKDQS